MSPNPASVPLRSLSRLLRTARQPSPAKVHIFILSVDRSVAIRFRSTCGRTLASGARFTKCSTTSDTRSSQYASHAAQRRTTADLFRTATPYFRPGAFPLISPWSSSSRSTSARLLSNARKAELFVISSSWQKRGRPTFAERVYCSTSTSRERLFSCLFSV